MEYKCNTCSNWNENSMYCVMSDSEPWCTRDLNLSDYTREEVSKFEIEPEDLYKEGESIVPRQRMFD